MDDDLYVSVIEGRACLRALEAIAAGRNAAAAIDHSVDACNGLHGIGWCDRSKDWFGYERKPSQGMRHEYNREHAMLALAMAATIAAKPCKREGGSE